MGNMRFKVGDRVRIKGLDWYNENKNNFGKVWCANGRIPFDSDMRKYCGKVMTISHVRADHYTMVEDLAHYWTDEMIEGLVEEETKPEPKFKIGDRVKWYNHTCNITSIDTNENTYIYLIKHNDYREDKTFAKWVPENELTFEDNEETKPNIIEEAKTYWDSIKDAWICPDGYQFKDENGNVINATKIIMEKKKTEYPKTYVECSDILSVYTDPDIDGYKGELLWTFQKLLICRDAYWKIAGEEMGLGKPWSPDYDSGVNKYGIICMNGVVQESNPTTNWERHLNKVLDFPTEEMRDAFKENFDNDLEFCKELL